MPIPDLKRKTIAVKLRLAPTTAKKLKERAAEQALRVNEYVAQWVESDDHEKIFAEGTET